MSARPTGRLDWRWLLQWLQDDGLLPAAEAARVRARFGAGASSQHPLLRLANASLADARPGQHGRALDAEALNGWRSTWACRTCASTR
jgi:general secretion pathway protein E